MELAHGGGGTKTAKLVETLFAPAFRNPHLEPLGDGALVSVGRERLAFTTDSFVVKPVFFPGGDIGSLAVHGTVNDLAMCGAEPLVPERRLPARGGLPDAGPRARRGLDGRRPARASGVLLVTGDTKVVDRGKGDGIYVNTSGIGRVRDGVHVGPARARARRRRDRVGTDRRPRHRGDGGARGHRLRDGPRLGLGAGDRPGAGAARRRARPPTCCATRRAAGWRRLFARSRSRRGSGSASTRRTCPCARRCAAPASCWASTRSTWPARVASSRSCRGPAPRWHSRRSGRSRAAKRPRVVGSVRAEDAGRVVLRTRIGSHRLLERLSGEQLPRIC